MPSVRVVFASLLFLSAGPALAEGELAGDTVAWSVSPANVTKGHRALLTLSGQVQPGWHVYGLKQAPSGPTPLVVALERNDVARAAGPVTGSPATTYHDPAFGLDTHFYSSAFTLTLPVRLTSHASGAQTIPVSVRFQTCNGRICQPPKTVHLSAPVAAGG
ncbi:MAG TPA: protein-disulfide reductase DsbD domain-containing protein [Rhizomicrobium sp.]|nr:protein-disulfide reductase DsbD domain-containing protein [Rhizomicrobium sp.]